MSISNRIQEMEERISGAEDSIENISTTIKENTKCKKILTQNIQEIQDTMRRPNLRIIGVDENEDFQLKGPANIFNKIIEENLLKKEMPMIIQDLKREVDTIKKTQSEAKLEIETLGKKSETMEASISNRIQEMKERISGAEDSIENISTTKKMQNATRC